LTEYNTELARIRELLENNPRGLTITEISNHFKTNRNSIAKYLDIMMISGEIDLRHIGRAKVYYPSHRIPIANLLDYSSDYILVVSEDDVITQANLNFCHFFNGKQEEIIGKNLSEVFSQEIKNLLDALIRNGLVSNLHVEINNHYFKPKIIPTVFIDGLKGTTLILEDITENVKMINTLIESDNKFHDFTRAATSGLLLTDSEFRIIETNEAGLKITGLSREEVIGKHILDFNKDTKKSGRYDLYQEIVKNKRKYTINEIKLPSELGGKRLIVSVFRAGPGIGMILTDISELEKNT